MKTLLTLLAFTLLTIATKAQYCGVSGPLVCDTTYFAVDTNRSFSNIPIDTLPCIIRSEPYNVTISIRTDSVWVKLRGTVLLLVPERL